MSVEEIDVLTLKARGAAIVERAADQMRQTLHDACEKVESLPFLFADSLFQGLEVEPTGLERKDDRGFVALSSDGQLYEVVVSISLGGDFDTPDYFEQDDEAKLLELPPHEYILYAHNALQTVTNYLLDLT